MQTNNKSILNCNMDIIRLKLFDFYGENIDSEKIISKDSIKILKLKIQIENYF